MWLLFTVAISSLISDWFHISFLTVIIIAIVLFGLFVLLILFAVEGFRFCSTPWLFTERTFLLKNHFRKIESSNSVDGKMGIRELYVYKTDERCRVELKMKTPYFRNWKVYVRLQNNENGVVYDFSYDANIDEKEKEQMLSAECAKLFHINPL